MIIEDFISKFPKKPSNANKGDFGHVLVIAGSSGYTGAAYLVSQASILSGSGLVTLAVGKGIYSIMATKLTEVMVRLFFETKDSSLSLLAEKDILKFSEKCESVAIGPGISQNKETQHLVRNLITKLDKPIVLDADGINAFVGHVNTLKDAKSKIVLTPHLGEMARLVEKDAAQIVNSGKDIALKFANEYNITLVLKGQKTLVVNPSGDCYINETGNVGMATGGTGDCLTGIIASFIGQGSDIFTASCLGVHFHGIAGDLAAKEKGTLSLIASDILNKLPEALKKLA